MAKDNKKLFESYLSVYSESVRETIYVPVRSKEQKDKNLKAAKARQEQLEAKQKQLERQLEHDRLIRELNTGEYNGSVDLEYANLTSLPENLKKINGVLKIGRSSIRSLPKGMEYIYALDAKNSRLESLPENLFIKQTLDITNTPISILPNNLDLNGGLFIDGTNITHIPENIKFKQLCYSPGKIKNIPVLNKFVLRDWSDNYIIWVDKKWLELLPANIRECETFQITRPGDDIPINILVPGKIDMYGNVVKEHGWIFEPNNFDEMNGTGQQTVRQYTAESESYAFEPLL